MNTFKVQNLDKSMADQIKSSIEEISKSEETPKQLTLELDSTTGDLLLAVEIVRMAHGLKVELITRASGKLSSAGTVLAGGGKIGRRSAGLQTQLVLNDAESEKIGKFRKVANPNLGLMEYMLVRTTNKKRGVKQALASMNVISSFEALELGILDTLEGFESMYAEELKPKSKKNSEVPVTQSESEVIS